MERNIQHLVLKVEKNDQHLQNEWLAGEGLTGCRMGKGTQDIGKILFLKVGDRCVVILVFIYFFLTFELSTYSFVCTTHLTNTTIRCNSQPQFLNQTAVLRRSLLEKSHTLPKIEIVLILAPPLPSCVSLVKWLSLSECFLRDKWEWPYLVTRLHILCSNHYHHHDSFVGSLNMENFSHGLHLQDQEFSGRMTVQTHVVFLHLADTVIFNNWRQDLHPQKNYALFCSATCFVAMVLWSRTCQTPEVCPYWGRTGFSWQGPDLLLSPDSY